MGDPTGESAAPIEEQVRTAILAALTEEPYGSGTVLETFSPEAVAIVATNAALRVVNPWTRHLIEVAAETVAHLAMGSVDG